MRMDPSPASEEAEVPVVEAEPAVDPRRPVTLPSGREGMSSETTGSPPPEVSDERFGIGSAPRTVAIN